MRWWMSRASSHILLVKTILESWKFFSKTILLSIIKKRLLSHHKATWSSDLYLYVQIRFAVWLSVLFFNLIYWNYTLISILMMHRVVSFYPAGPVQQSGLVKDGAGNGNWTRLSGLEGRRTSQCTTPAEKVS